MVRVMVREEAVNAENRAEKRAVVGAAVKEVDRCYLFKYNSALKYYNYITYGSFINT